MKAYSIFISKVMIRYVRSFFCYSFRCRFWFQKCFKPEFEHQIHKLKDIRAITIRVAQIAQSPQRNSDLTKFYQNRLFKADAYAVSDLVLRLKSVFFSKIDLLMLF